MFDNRKKEKKQSRYSVLNIVGSLNTSHVWIICFNKCISTEERLEGAKGACNFKDLRYKDMRLFLKGAVFRP